MNKQPSNNELISSKLPMYVVLCPTTKGTAVKKKRIYFSLEAVKSTPTNNKGDKWRIYKISELCEVEEV